MRNVTGLRRVVQVCACVALCSAVIVGSAWARTTPDADDAAYDQIELLTEALIHVRQHYVEEKDYEEIVRGALHGMLHALDPHSSFLEPDALREIQDNTAGQFGGIGIKVGQRDGMLTVIAPIEDTPAFRAGLQSGDRIIEIDGVPTRGKPLPECVKLMRGLKGEAVELVVVGPDEDEPRKVSVVRDVIKVSSVKGARMLRDGVGYVRITSFDEGTADNLQAALDKLEDSGMDALVLDLRGNPGGLLRSAVAVAQKFLKRGAVVVTRKGRPGVHPPAIDRALGRVHETDLPMAVLVNGGSASASEIVAGALRDHKRAVLVGSTTYGKASVQSVIRLVSGDESKERALRLTTAHYYTPSGAEIHNKGIEPNIYVYVPPSEWRDVQIRRSHDEEPESYSDEEKEPFREVEDRQLSRAVDLLEALKIYEARRR